MNEVAGESLQVNGTDTRMRQRNVEDLSFMKINRSLRIGNRPSGWSLSLISLLFAWPAAGLAAAGGCPDHAGIEAYADGVRITLSTGANRLPYGRAITLVVNPGRPAKSVRVDYSLDGGKTGPRTGSVPAASDDGECWSATIPSIHVNEHGRLVARASSPIKYKSGKDARSLVVEFLRGLRAIALPLSPEDYQAATRSAARKAITATLDADVESVVVPSEGGADVALESSLGDLASGDLDVANLVDGVRARARAVVQLMEALEKRRPAWRTRENSACNPVTTWGGLLESARRLSDSEEAVLEAMTSRELPWPPCCTALLEDSEAFKIEIVDRELMGIRIASLYALTGVARVDQLRGIAEGLKTIETIVQQATVRTELSLDVRTINVPVGAEALERYTQLDVVMAFMPHGRIGMVQSFAASTLYLFSRGQKASASDLHGRDRFGIQIGYPIGGPVQKPLSDFEPRLLIGLQWRANAFVSLSIGAVAGKSQGRQTSTLALTTNLDLSNLGPLRELLARQDH